MRVSLFYVVLSNVIKSFFLKPILERKYREFKIKKMTFFEAFYVIGLYEEVFDKPYGFLRSLFLIVVSHRFSISAFEENGKLVGFNLFRLGARDISEGTIHESFIGVKKTCSGYGLGTALRMFAVELFKKNGFRGISSKIAYSNNSSLESAKKVGFNPVENYINSDGEEEAYLVLIFDLVDEDHSNG